MWWRRLTDRISDAEVDFVVDQTDLPSECEAFLAGGYRRFLESQAQPVPAWAWINSLAHGGDDDVRALAELAAADGSPASMVSRIAAHVVQLVHEHDIPLCELQRRTLIPLETSLATSTGHHPLSSAELGRAIMTALSAGLTAIPSVPPRQRRQDSGGRAA